MHNPGGTGVPPNTVSFAENRGMGILPMLGKPRMGRMPMPLILTALGGTPMPLGKIRDVATRGSARWGGSLGARRRLLAHRACLERRRWEILWQAKGFDNLLLLLILTNRTAFGVHEAGRDEDDQVPFDLLIHI